MKFVPSEGAQLRCEYSASDAPALLLLNALGTRLQMWDDQVGACGKRYELVRYDTRGHGESTIGESQALTLDQLPRDAIAVLDSCGIARAHLCGISMGGMTAMHLARKWPDRVHTLALCNTSAHMPPKDAWDARIKTVIGEGMSAVAPVIIERWFTPAFRQATSESVERIRQMLLGTDPRGYAACCAAIRDMDLRDSLRSITARTLVIAGSKDLATPPSHAEFIASHIAGAKLVTLESAHLSNIEQTREFNATLLEFLAG